MISACDISKYQGSWQDRGDPIVMIKMSGGDNGLYMDSMASQNYNGAVSAGRAVGGYHFAGWTNPTAEANYFMQAMRPLAENDVYALDAEAIPAGVDPVGWSTTFMETVHNAIGVWPLIYMNLSTLNSYNWNSVLANCGLWLGDWNNDPNGTISTVHTYVMQQYSDGPGYDHDEWFGTVEEFQKYGYHAPQTPVVSPVEPIQTTPDPEPIVLPEPTTPTNSTVPPVETSVTAASPVVPVENEPASSKPVVSTISRKPWYDFILNFIAWLFS